MIALFPELLTYASEGKIELLATSILKYFASGKTQRRVPMEEILQRFGITVARQEINCFGMIAVKDEKGTFRIACVVRPSMPYPEEQFCLAHLFGHFLLHIQGHIARGEWGSSGFREERNPLQRYLEASLGNTSEVRDDKERAADSFAVQLLLPRVVMEKAAKAGLSQDHLASLLGTSAAAVAKRSAELCETPEREAPVRITVRPKSAVPVSQPASTARQGSSGENLISAQGMDKISRLASRLAKNP